MVMPRKPLIIHHRRNTIDDLIQTAPEFGVEIDIRSDRSELILAHDPFDSGVSFSEWALKYRHKFAIFNVKEEGLEDATLAISSKAGIQNFFFLDQSIPFLVKTVMRGERRSAVRVSEFESVQTALNFAPYLDWVWVDTFTTFPLDRQSGRQLRRAGLKLCLVSPDLVGRGSETDLENIKQMLWDRRVPIDAVCTKHIDQWTSWVNPEV